jgi:hypothetical protein
VTAAGGTRDLTEFRIIAAPAIMTHLVTTAFQAGRVVECSEAKEVPGDDHRIEVRIVLRNP